ncbi:helix-turn-helix domain-containing protein [Halorubrum sp. RMP-47]|uniref:Helix-turn-helix domain-containing protein n=1 Tax=Halorubrum miltondacostae TaxID=3076378 RepID=A0ABD5LWV1_9EURY
MSDEDTDGRLSPDDAFAALSDEHRVRILRVLGDAEAPLAFSELYDRLPVDDTARFNYHLDELRGHFVRKTPDGYALDYPGRRVVEAIRSGAVTEEPEIERTTVDDRCPTCENPLEIQWLDGSVEVFCPTCESRWDRSHGRVGGPGAVESGYLGRLPFPPAGLRDRTPREVLRAAHAWTNVELIAVGCGVCPRCAAAVRTELDGCRDHDDEGVCSDCRSRFAVLLRADCPNCPYRVGGAAALGLLSAPELLAFMLDHGLDPFSPRSVLRHDRVLNEYDERILSMNPLRVELTFSADGDTLSLRVDEHGDVVDVVDGPT